MTIKMTIEEDKMSEVKVALRWRNSSAANRLTIVFGTALCTYVLLYLSGIFDRLGIYIGLGPHRAIGLGLFLALAFLNRPATKGGSRDNLPWYDILLILMSLLPTAYYAFFQDAIIAHRYSGFASPVEVVMCGLLIVAILEAGRRVVGWFVPAIALFFILHPLLSGYMPGILFGKALSIQRVVSVFYLSESGIFGTTVGVATTIVITFMIFSQLLLSTGASEFFIGLALSLCGTVRGGPAKAAVVASALFGCISGSPTSNVASTGSVTIPLMKKTGYTAEFAGAVEAVASTGGQIMPPVMGTVAFLMADVTGAGYGAVCIAAALPAFLYYLSIFLQVDMQAAVKGLRGIPRSALPAIRFKDGWQHLLSLVVLIVAIVYFRYDAEMAALYAIAVLWVVSLFRKESRLGFGRLVGGFVESSRTALWAAIPCAVAGMIVGSISVTGLGLVFSGQLVNLAGGNLLLLLALAALASFILGMGTGVVSIYIILSVLVAPALVTMGVHILAAHLFLIYWAISSFITPPVALAAFVAAGIAEADSGKVGWQAVRLGIVAYLVPFMFALNANMILVGSGIDIAFTTISALVGVFVLAAGMEGFLIRKMTWLPRTLFLAGGILFLYPNWQTSAVGIGILLPGLIWHIGKVILPARLRVEGGKEI